MAPTINLYYSPGACSLASHILLLETPLPFNTTQINVKAGFPPSFRHINPKMRVPVLVLDDQSITETPAIMTAISQLAQEKNLMGSTPMETVRVYEWLNWLSGTLHAQAFGGLFRAHRFSDDEATFPVIKVKARKTVEECFAVIESDLKGVHAVGDGFTAVDAFLYVFYRWGASIGVDMQGNYPKYTALVVDVVKREAVQKALEAEEVESYVPKL